MILCCSCILQFWMLPIYSLDVIGTFFYLPWEFKMVLSAHMILRWILILLFWYIGVFWGKSLTPVRATFPLSILKVDFSSLKEVKVFPIDMLYPKNKYWKLTPHWYLGSFSSPDFAPGFPWLPWLPPVSLGSSDVCNTSGQLWEGQRPQK